MPAFSGGHIIVDGEEIPVGSSRFSELMLITDATIREIQVDNDIANVMSALATAVMKLEFELRDLRADADPR